MVIEFIYDPERVGETLKGFPSLSRKLGDPADEEQTNSFPYARKSSRQIYRILSNAPEYPHLTRLLQALDDCIANGWEQPALIKRRQRQEFESAVSELLVAESFRRSGFTIRGCDSKRGADSVPDIMVHGENLALCAEIYCPRDWEGMNHFIEDVRLGLLHLDVPWDFSFELRLSLLNEFSPEGVSLSFDPWRFSEAVENGGVEVRPILAQVQECLKVSAKEEVTVCSREEGQNVFIQVRLKQIERSKSRMPSRLGAISSPSLTGYDPVSMFDRLVKGKIVNKLKKRQAHASSGQALRGLIVDVSKLGCVTEFEDRWYLEQFGKSLTMHLGLESIDVDLLVFDLPNTEDGLTMRWPLVYRKANVSDEVLAALFGRNERFVVDRKN